MATITRIADRTDGLQQWAVFDGLGMHHVTKFSREAAEAFADEKLKPRGQG